jgi:hypothetical protein
MLPQKVPCPMKRLEERVSCEDENGKRYEVEVYRTVEREGEGPQVIGAREALLVGDPNRPVKVFDDQNVFQTRGGTILRRAARVD